MTISVIIPAFNEEQYIQSCIESILNQQVKPDEIIVINNNSTDKTGTIAQKFPVRIINEKEQGMIQARNRGFNEAKYEIIARTDADTRVPSNWIKKIKEHFAKEDLVALSGLAHFYDTRNALEEKAALQNEKSYFAVMKQALGHDCLYGPNMAVRKSAWEKIKKSACQSDKEVHEDIDLAIHLAPLGKIKLDKTLVVYSSFRRFKKITSLLEYSYRVIKSVNKHKQYIVNTRKRSIQDFILRFFSPK